MKGSFLLSVVLLQALGCGLGARILVVLPFPARSHFFFLSAILKALSQRGHHIVEYSPFPPSKPLPNYTHVEVHTFLEDLVNDWSFEEFEEMAQKDQPVVGLGFMSIWNISSAVCAEAFQHENFKKLINSNEKFDLVITESSFGQESMLVFGHRFSAPTVTLQTFSSWSGINKNAGNALSIAFIPDIISYIASDQMSFHERFLNFISTVTTLFMYYNHQLPLQDNVLKENYKMDAPPVADMVSNVSLYLINTHPTVEYAQPYTPNIIPVGGIVIEPDRTSLPEDIKKFMDGASKEGVIYFSLGTLVPIHRMPKEKLQMFVNVFSKLKQKVLWRINLDTIPGLSANVKLTKWVPQPGVLAHPNCVLFLTHGGLFGQQEAIHAGVPTVNIPFFGDQPYNAKFAEHRGIGVKLMFNDLSDETISTAIRTVLDNPKYKENAQRISRIFRDRPMSPADSAVFWVEYVLRHRGAHHLRSAATQLSWYQLALLDILAVFMAVIVILCFVLRRIYSLLFVWKKQPKVTKKKKEN
ncbi:UDP-glycosyltransferase UGT5-like isoform X1 [Homalodisca vitripennis]|uniref:UDP-glycosyltransferase UGT5-like isoform X1 n=1 Tax=Homalodisca vitripennis TaxID=197043 RepID=UPI001EEB9448|nr:UDP-glycosyltransferase UGT5-like isoform X1 [Homalodisca vitripennis]